MDELVAEVLPPGWDVDDELLTCPHGHVIELDGSCPDGCTSRCASKTSSDNWRGSLVRRASRLPNARPRRR